eukprot:1987428-Amphidinium_carterae.1
MCASPAGAWASSGAAGAVRCNVIGAAACACARACVDVIAPIGGRGRACAGACGARSCAEVCAPIGEGVIIGARARAGDIAGARACAGGGVRGGTGRFLLPC